MRRRPCVDLPKTGTLKIDIDAQLEADLSERYIQHVVEVCKKHRARVLRVKQSETIHGRHYYIEINPPVQAHEANVLQFLLCDDARRYAFNKARVDAGFLEWSKLFEPPNARLRTIYRDVKVAAATNPKKRR